MQLITSYEYLNLLRLLFCIMQAGNNEPIRVIHSMYCGKYRYFVSGGPALPRDSVDFLYEFLYNAISLLRKLKFTIIIKFL